MTVLTKDEARRLEQEYAAEDSKELIQLMENAGDQIARFVFDKTGIEGKAIAVVCGHGNNGGDGFVAARKFLENGGKVCVIMVDGEPQTNDAIDVMMRAERAGVHIIRSITDENRGSVERFLLEADIVVDAIFGIGFHGELPEHLDKVAEWMNITEAAVVSADIPSGVSADTGEVARSCVRADYTIAFTALKPGHITYPGADMCGKIITVPVGIDQEKLDVFNSSIATVDYQSVRLCFQPRKANTHKGSYGTLAAVCGSYGMAGAAVFACRAAAQSGVGLVKAVLPQSIYPIVCAHTADPVFLPLEDSGYGTLRALDADRIMKALGGSTACLVGCGMGVNVETKAILRRILSEYDKTLVLDADALRMLQDQPELLKETKARVIITPHPGEMAGLESSDAGDIQRRRLRAARGFAEEYGVTVVLKGANTVVAVPKGRTYINLTGNPGMSKGGSGDVLAGLIASLAAQGMPADEAALCGVYIHGAAGDRAAEKYSQHGMTPTDIIFDIPTVFRDIER